MGEAKRKVRLLEVFDAEGQTVPVCVECDSDSPMVAELQGSQM